MRKRLKILLIVLLIAGALWAIFFGLIWKSTLNISGIDGASIIKIDGKSVAVTGKTLTVKTSPGTHRVTVIGPFVRTDTRTAETKMLSESVLAFDSKRLTATELAEYLGESDAKNYETRVTRAKLVEDDTWLVATYADKAQRRDAYNSIYHYTGTEWELVSSGTGFDTYGVTDLPYPKSVAEALKPESP